MLRLSSTDLSQVGTYYLDGFGDAVAVDAAVRADYLTGTSGDTLNYTTYGPYRYFTFTK